MTNQSLMPLGEYDRDTVSISEIITSLVQRRLLIGGVALLASLAAYLYVTSIVDTYTASTELMLYPQQERVLGSEELIPAVKPDDMMISTQTEIIESRVMAEYLVDTFDLANDPSWNGVAPRKKGFAAWWSGVLNPRDQFSFSEDAKYRNAVETVMKQTGAEQIGDSLVIAIRASAFDAQRASDLANELRKVYIESQTVVSDEASTKASGWFKERLEALEVELRQKEAAVASFRESNGLIATSGSTLTEQQVMGAQGSVSSARAQLVEKEAQLAQVISARNSTDRLAEIGLAVGSAQVAELRRKKAEISQRIAENASLYGTQHPERIMALDEAADIDRQIAEEIDRIIRNMRDEVEIARSRLKLAEDDRARFESRLVDNNRSLVRLNQLERDAEATKEVYEDYVRRFQEVNDQASLGTSSARLIAAAVPPFRSDTPSLALSLIAAFCIGALLGTGLAFLLNAMDDRIRTRTDVEELLGKPVYGVVPLERHGYIDGLVKGVGHATFGQRLVGAKLPPWDWLVKHKFSRFGESFRLIQKYIQYSNMDKGGVVVSVTSAVPDEGKTTISICLARSIAMTGRKTLLIDGDTHTRSVSRAFLADAEATSGLAAAMSGEVPLKDLLIKDSETGVEVLANVESDMHEEDIFSRQAMKDLLARMAETYDVIIFDSPPILALSDATVQSSLSNQTLMIVRSQVTPARLARASIQQIEESGGRVMGVVLNCVRPDHMGIFASGDRSFYKKIQKSYYHRS